VPHDWHKKSDKKYKILKAIKALFIQTIPTQSVVLLNSLNYAEKFPQTFPRVSFSFSFFMFWVCQKDLKKWEVIALQFKYCFSHYDVTTIKLNPRQVYSS
jgi:hypothetical protein